MPQTIRARVETPPPYGQCPNACGMNLRGASLSALGVSDPVIESQEIKETQEFPSILKMLKGAKRTKGAKGKMRKGEKQ